MPDTTVSFLVRRYRNTHPIRTLGHLYSGSRGYIALALVLVTIKHIPALLLPILSGRIIDTVSHPDIYPLSRLWFYGGLMGLFLLQNIPTHSFYTLFLSRAIRSVEAQLRSALVRRMQELSIAFHEEFRSGTLHTKVLRDVESVEGLSREVINVIYVGAINIIFAFTVTLLKQPLIALFFLVTIPAAAAVLEIFRRRIRQENKEFRGQIELMSAAVSEMIEMIPITRAHGAEQTEIRRMDTQLQKVKHRGIRLDFVNALFTSSTWVSFQSFQFLCLIVSGYFAYTGRISIGDVVMYQGFFGMVMGAVNNLLGMYPSMARGFESIRSMGEILECPDIEQNHGKKAVAQVNGSLTFQKTTFSYPGGRRPALSELELDVRAGESVAFVGESGAGKSTVMSLVIGFRRPTSGRILLDGVDMATLDLRTYRQFLSVVPQQTILFSGSIRENISYGLTGIEDRQLRTVIEMANASEFIDRLPQGLDTQIGEHGAKLSGGQRQRIAIARALIRDPRIIIFDEATSSLDVISEKLVQEAINRLMEGRTTFIVAHRLSTIRSAHRIVVLKDGRCIEMGTHDELMEKRGEYSRLRSLQV
jgi:ATP-binding cassette, subfamily B, bacterial